MKWYRKERCCCGCSSSMGARILATISGMVAAITLFTDFIFETGLVLLITKALYIFACIICSAFVFQAVKRRRSVLMSPMLLLSIFNIILLVVALIIATLQMFGVQTFIYQVFKSAYDNNDNFKSYVHDNCDDDVGEFARSYGFWTALVAFFLIIFAVWVFFVYLDCFRVLKESEGYPEAHYHGDDNITVPDYPAYPPTTYDAAAAAATANPSPTYPGSTFDSPPAYENVAQINTADETPVKSPIVFATEQ